MYKCDRMPYRSAGLAKAALISFNRFRLRADELSIFVCGQCQAWHFGVPRQGEDVSRVRPVRFVAPPQRDRLERWQRRRRNLKAHRQIVPRQRRESDPAEVLPPPNPAPPELVDAFFERHSR